MDWHSQVDFFIGKVGSIAATLAGILCMAIIWKPAAFRGFALIEVGMAIGAVGTGVGVFVVDGVAEYFGILDKVNSTLALGFFIGLTAFGMINLIATFFRKAERGDRDIFDAVDDIKKTAGDLLRGKDK